MGARCKASEVTKIMALFWCPARSSKIMPCGGAMRVYGCRNSLHDRPKSFNALTG